MPGGKELYDREDFERRGLQLSFISPFRAERDFARSLFEPGEFYEVFVDTPMAECENRDVKGSIFQSRFESEVVAF